MLRRFITPECHPSCAWSVYCTRVPWSSAECYKLLPVSQFSSLLSSSYCKSQVSAIYLKLQMAPKQQRGRPSGQKDKPRYRTGQPSKLNTRETNQTTLSFARIEDLARVKSQDYSRSSTKMETMGRGLRAMFYKVHKPKFIVKQLSIQKG
ncbi:hypothetical protein VTP01DRAFT_6287 [Rhizomucor pusillus]|uniref:uncharacterized protein n=1 Tax=Rhizomucor pusillus TaxID=4840 RepID=UPI0037423884